MAGKAQLWMAGILAVVVSGCYTPDWADIDQAMTRHKLRALEKRYEQLNGTYRIGIPDTITVNIPDHPDLSGTYEVRLDGNMTFMLLGDVYVEGLTPMQVSEMLARKLERFVKKVEVYVTVTGSYSKSIYVFDRTKQSGRFLRFTGDQSALDVLASTGGWNREAYSSKMRLVRDNPEQREIYRIRGDRMVRGDLSSNILLKEKDMLYLPASPGAEVAYALEAFFQPFRAIFTGLREAGGAPFAATQGYYDYQRDRDQQGGR